MLTKKEMIQEALLFSRDPRMKAWAKETKEAGEKPVTCEAIVKYPCGQVVLGTHGLIGWNLTNGVQLQQPF